MNQLSAKFNMTPTQHANTQWFLHYIFHPPALACFLIGFFGLLSVEIQLLAMGPLVAKFQDRAASTVTDFSTLIATNINNSMYNQSSLYANDLNGRVDVVQSTINNGLFGWVNGTTSTLNDTINAFYTDVQDAVNTVFGGTILQSPIDDFIKCFIGSKVDAIETALTFLHDNLNVDMPRVNQSALVLSPDSINEAAQPIAAAAIGGGSGDKEGLIGRLLNSYAASLRKERVMFGIFMGLWLFVVLMGLSVIVWHSIVRPYLDARGRKKWQEEQRSGIETFGTYRTGSTDEKRGNFSSFSPLPSPKGSAFKPFWGSRSNSPFPTGQNRSASSSQESVIQNNNQEPSFPGAYPEPQIAPQAVEKKTGAKLLAIGRKAIRRERLKKDGSDEELAVPLSPSYISAPEGSRFHKKDSAWYTKMGNLLARKEKPAENEHNIVPLWPENPPPMTETETNRPKLQIYTQKALDKYGPPSSSIYYPPPPPRAAQQPESTRSVSPEVPRPEWGSVMSPTPVVMVSQEPEASLASSFPQPPIGVPIRPRHHIVSLPNDVGPVYEESVRRAPPIPPVLPMPLYNGFENLQQPRSHPQHPQLEAYGRRRQDTSPPPPLKSPRMYLPQVALAPPSHPDRHRRSSSMGTTSHWRVTNAVPGESPRSSTASFEQKRQNDPNLPSTSVTRLLTTTHARQSSNVNPFITPFDDEHQVVIDYPTGPGTRKSIPTNPFVHAI